MAAPPFAKKDDLKNPSGGAAEHLNALESLVKTARGRAALNTLRGELTGDGSSNKGRDKPKNNARAEALERFAKS
jgi:hypothetical protein